MTLVGGGKWLGSELHDVINSCQSMLGKLRGIRGIAIFSSLCAVRYLFPLAVLTFLLQFL